MGLLFGRNESLVGAPRSVQACQGHRVSLTIPEPPTNANMHLLTRLLQGIFGCPAVCIKPRLITASPGDGISGPASTCACYLAHHVDKL
jgi:hypothetical protein